MSLPHSKACGGPILPKQLSWHITEGASISPGFMEPSYHDRHHEDKLYPHAQGCWLLLYFMSLLLMVWGGFWLIVTVSVRVAIITKYSRCGFWVFQLFWERFPDWQCILSAGWTKWMEGIGENVWRMFFAEDSHDQAVEDHTDQTEEDDIIAWLTRNYPWWTPKLPAEEKNKASPIKGKCIFGYKNPFILAQKTTP